MDEATAGRRSWRGGRWGVRDVILPVVGFALLGVGVGFRIWAALHPVSYGWFAYAPLSDERFDPTAGSTIGPWGLWHIVAGLVVLAFWGGLLVGRRRALQPGLDEGGR